MELLIVLNAIPKLKEDQYARNDLGIGKSLAQIVEAPKLIRLKDAGNVLIYFVTGDKSGLFLALP